MVITVLIPICAQAQTDSRAEAVKLVETGQALYKSGEKQKALETYSRALPLLRELGESRQEAAALAGIALVYSSIGERQKAIEFNKQALTIRRSIGDRNAEAITLSAIGSSYEALGDKQTALDYLLQALSLHRSLRSEQAEAHTLYVIGSIYDSLNDKQKAIPYFNQAIELRRRIGHYRGKVFLEHELGNLYVGIGDNAQALIHYQNALALYEEQKDYNGIARSLRNLGLLYDVTGQKQKALETYNRALPLFRLGSDRQSYGRLLTNLGKVLSESGQHDAALVHLREGLNVVRKLDNKFFEVYALYWIARSERARGDLTEARSKIDEAISKVETIRSGFYDSDLSATGFTKAQDLFEFQIDLLIQLNDSRPDPSLVARAFEASEQSRARSLLDLLEETKIDNPETLSADAARTLVDDDTAILEYFFGKQSSFLFVVTHQAVKCFRLPKSEEIGRLTDEFRTALRQPGRREFSTYARAAEQLYRALIAPAGKLVDSKRKLIVAPDGELHQLPFEALLTNVLQDTRDPDYLIKRWAVSYTPSVSVLGSLEARRSDVAGIRDQKILVFADPAYGETGQLEMKPIQASMRVAKLPQSNLEAMGIAKLYSPGDVTLYLNCAASEENVKSPSSPISNAWRIHFATHGYISEGKTQLSGLVLALDDDPKEDGLLQVSEIFKLKLKADLVVLSACQTGLGRQLKGEGVIGLTRAFMYAGASSVVVSLWSVSDRSTADLMIRFYEQLDRSNNKAEALRQAKLRLIQNGRFAHPYYWAPFVLSGRTGEEGRRINDVRQPVALSSLMR